MNTRTLRRIALALIALLVYAQGSVALASCTMDRGAMSQAAAAHACCDSTDDQSAPPLGIGCVAHCTADLQLFELPVVLVRSPADAAVLTLPVAVADSVEAIGGAASPLSGVPVRILFQSFLI